MDGEKKPVRLTIYNQTFSLLSAADPEDLQHAASEVDEIMRAIAKSGSMDPTRVAILACLHLQDRVHALELELDELKASVDDRSRQLARLLDDVLPRGT